MILNLKILGSQNLFMGLIGVVFLNLIHMPVVSKENTISDINRENCNLRK
jgi:hypothetical protein